MAKAMKGVSKVSNEEEVSGGGGHSQRFSVTLVSSFPSFVIPLHFYHPPFSTSISLLSPLSFQAISDWLG